MSPIKKWVCSGAFIALTFYLGYVVERPRFPAFITTYGLFFALYTWLITRLNWSQADRRWWIGLGIGLRVLLLFSIPNLSDDFYRFLWDGRLSAQGIHPFAHTPAYFIENQIALTGITPELFANLNSPAYYTVYPPVCQAVFWMAAKLYPESLAGGVFVLKLFLFFCELGVLWVLTPPPSPIAINLRVKRGCTTFKISNFSFQISNRALCEHPFYLKLEIGKGFSPLVS